MLNVKRRVTSCLLVICILVTLMPSFGITAGAVLAENEAIYSVNVDTDGADNVIVAEYNGQSYVMGPIKADGTADAIPAVKRDAWGNNIVVDESAAELFKASEQRYTYSGGSYPVYSFLTEDGYIADSYSINESEEHKLIKAAKESVTLSDYPYLWRFDWTPGWYNWNSSYRIYLVVNGSDLHFELGYGTPAEGVQYITVNIFHKSCQHPNMEYVPAAAPTCKQNGNGEYWYCPDCEQNGYTPYFSDADGLNVLNSPPVTLSYGAVDDNGDGVCDDCGKNMPVFKQVTEDSQIVAGGKYILVTKVGDKYYAAATGNDEYPSQLPAVEITPSADGSFTFEGTTEAMTIELQFAHGHTEWGNGIRYGFLTKFNGSLSLLLPMSTNFWFDEYDIRGAKYGAYVGLNADGTAKIHSAYMPSAMIRAYTKNDSQMFSLMDYSGDTSYTESSVYLYRLTDTGTVGTNTYDMTAVKSETDYTTAIPEGSAAEGGTNVTGITDALTQTAINSIVSSFVSDCAIADGESIQIHTSVNVVVIGYTVGSSITFSLNPTAAVSAGLNSESYPIPDSAFDGSTPMTVTLYTDGITPAQIIHEKEDGTNEYFYPEYSEEVLQDGENPFYALCDNDGNLYVLFTVTEFSNVRLLTQPEPEVVAVTGVTIDETLAVDIGENETPSWTVAPAEASNKNVTFTSSDPSVATVNETTGEVTGLKKGTAIITVKTEDGSFTDTCTVTVSCTHANKTDVPEKASTCLAPGWDAYKKCSDCGQLFKADGTTEISEIPYRPLSTEHTGGTATCTEKAVCDVCDQPYGNYAAHDYSSAAKIPAALKTAGNCRDRAVYYYSCSACGAVEHNDSHTFEGDKDASSHVGGTTIVNEAAPDHKNQTPGYTGDTKCLGCGAILASGSANPADAHTPADAWSYDGAYHWKTCTSAGCGAIIDGSQAAHSSTGTNAATCQHKAICDVCHVEYGEKVAHNPASGWTNDASGHWHACQTAGCTEKCDFAAHTPDHTGHATEEYAIKCSICGYVIEAQLGHTHVFDQEVAADAYKASGATCTAKATYYKSCACGEKGTETFVSGELAPHNWTPATCTAAKTCADCGITEGTALGHTEGTEWKSDASSHWHICTAPDCGAVMESSKAAHTASDWITDTQATASADGTKHKECTVCHRVLETGTIPATGSEDSAPQMIEGDGSKVTSGGNVALSFRSDAAFSDFIRVEIDGKPLDAQHYTVKEGSTIVTLNGDYVAALSVGEHTIGIVSAGGTATAAFTVEAKQQTTDPTDPSPGEQPPQTGDNSMLSLWAALLFASGAAAAGAAIYGKKKKYSA